MFLRKMRWLCAAIVATIATVASPAVSKADTQILIQELDGSGNPVGGQLQITTGTSATFATTNFTNISVTTSFGSGAIGSLTSSVSAGLSGSFDPTHTLQVIVTNDGFTNPFPGEPATIANTVGASSAIVGGTNNITGTTQILAVPLTDATTQTAVVASGSVIAGPTSAASDTRPGGGSSNETGTTSASLPGNYAIQQTIIVRATPNSGGSIASGSTVGGTAGSTVLTSAAPVPAPAGLVLALAAVPALGLRRILRRKTA
ncbi:MAG: hypothetical protein U0791_15930 [Gemmataceae bacterium]